MSPTRTRLRNARATPPGAPLPPPPFRNVLTLHVPSHRSTPRECSCTRRTNAAVTVSHLYVLGVPIHKLKLKHSEASGLPRARLE